MGFLDKRKQKSGTNFKGRGSKSYSGDYNDSSARTLTAVTCDSCGEYCKVPFKPSAGKPVYCNNCFRKEPSYSDKKPSRFNSRPGSYREENKPESRHSRSDLDQINAKLDRILELLEQ